MNEYEFAGVCRFNLGVACTDKEKCRKCGFNPAVEAIRKIRIRVKILEEKDAS